MTRTPLQERAITLRERASRGEKLTAEEVNTLILAMPRKLRRKYKVRTTDVRETLDALRTMPMGVQRNKAKAVRRAARAKARA